MSTKMLPLPALWAHAIDTFDFRSAPLNSIAWPIGGVVVYLAVIYSIQFWVEGRRRAYLKKHGLDPKRDADREAIAALSPELWAFNIKYPFALHNLLLSGASLVMCVAAGREMLARTEREGGNAEWSICEHSADTRGALWFWSYCYYLSKYWELLDTVFLALKGSLKGWGGLNVYHHSMIVVLSYLWLSHAGTLQFWGLLCNTGVHVVMYAYFGVTQLGLRPPLRRVITSIQVTQFVFSVVLAIMSARLHLLDGRACQGMTVMYCSIAFNITLLSEFATILTDKKGSAAGGRAKKPAAAKAVAAN